MFASDKKREANQQNGRKGQGPTTQAGKDRSRLNAVKHGLLSRLVVLPGREDEESQEEYNEVRQELMDDLQPRGAMQEHLVEKIAADMWVLRRRYRAEAGALATELAARDVQHDQHATFEAALSRVLNPLRYTVGDTTWDTSFENLTDIRAQGAIALWSCAEGLAWTIDFLKSVAAQSMRNQRIARDDWETLLGLYAHTTGRLGQWCQARLSQTTERYRLSRPGQSVSEELPVDPVALRAPAATHLEVLIRAEVNSLTERLAEMETEQEALLAQDVESRSLVDGASLDGILRYEESVTNGMHRALKELRELQKVQRGEPATPTTNRRAKSDGT